MRAANPALNVEILGVNLIGQEAYTATYTAGNSLPWLQDVAAQNVRASWSAVDRDVCIVDSGNRLVAVYNLWEHVLDDASNREALKALFLEAAGWVDTDLDTLSDDWEMLHFQDLSSGPADDPDRDGEDNFAEYAFGTDPRDGGSRPGLRTGVVAEEGDRFLTVGFHQRMGSQVRFLMETSVDSLLWSGSDELLILDEPIRNLFDGTGTSRTTVRLTTPFATAPRAFFRVRALPRELP